MAVYPLQSSNTFAYSFRSQNATGNKSFISIDDHPSLNLGGSNFTIECWLKPDFSGSGWNDFFSKNISGSTYGYMGALASSSGFLTFYANAATSNFGSTYRVTPNVWCHVAFVHNAGANTQIYLNGTRVAVSTGMTSISNVNSELFIGSAKGFNEGYTGLISNFRIIKGQAIYAGDFGISPFPMQLPNNAIGYHSGTTNVASSLTGNVVVLSCNDQKITNTGNTANVKLYVSGDVTAHIVDITEQRNFSYFFPGNTSGQSQNGTVLVTSSSSVLNLTSDFTIETWYYPINNSPFPPSSNGSVLFNGTNQYLTLATHTSAFAFGTGDFTIEAWVYTTSSRGGGVTQDKFIFGGFSLTPAMVFFITNDSNAPALWDGTTQRTANTGIPPNKWTHIAFTRSGTSANFYIDGKLDRTLPSFTTNFTGPASPHYIGGNGAADRYFPGAISNLRVVNGVAVYTGNFTVPTSPLTTTQSSSTNIAAISGSQTVLLACQDKSGATFTDSSSNNFSITGTNTPVNQNIPVSTGVILERGFGGVGNNNASYILLWDAQNNSINFAAANANNVAYSVGSLTGASGNIGIPTLNAWNHIAVTRAANTYRGFLNGNLNLSIINNANTPYLVSARGVTIGGMFQNGQTYATGIPSNTISGYISNMRIIRGNSIYNAAFTVSNTQSWNVTNTILLTGLTPAFEDLSGNHTLATNGASEITFSPASPFLANSVINANVTSVHTRHYSSGQDESRIYNKFDFMRFGQMMNIYAALAQEEGRIYDKEDVGYAVGPRNDAFTLGQDQGKISNKLEFNRFSMQTEIYHTLAQDQGRIYNKLDVGKMAFSVPLTVYTLGQDQGKIYAKQSTRTDFAYIPVGGIGSGAEYQFWS